MDVKLRLGKRIRELRIKNRLTQQDLAEKADFEYKYLQRIEGKNPPNIGIELLEKIAKALKTTPAKLLSSE